MIYAMSDVHGCYDKHQTMLEVIKFTADDTLYVLGDVLDRGPDGFKILWDMAQRPNVVNLMGNHEAMAVKALSSIIAAIQRSKEHILTGDEAEAAELWFGNGGKPSLADFLRLSQEQQQTVLDYLLTMPLYREVEVGNRKFVLVHGGLENFSLSRPLADYEPDEILWCDPDLDAVYFPDKTIVFGHTPTRLLHWQIGEPEQPDRIFYRGTMIGIDCGCAFQGGRLGCLYLDIMEEFYV